MQSFTQFILEQVNTENSFPLTASAQKSLRTALRNKDKKVASETIKEIYPIIQKFQTDVHSDFLRFLKKETNKYQGVKILSGIKPLPSIISKVVERGKDLFKLGDLVRGAILFDNHSDALDFARKIKRKFGDQVVNYEEKEKGQDATFGYFGSAHIDLFFKGLVTEIQIMTKKLWNYKAAAHDIYNQNRENPKAVSRTDQAASRRFFTLGNRPSYVREDVDMLVLGTIAFSENELEDFFDLLEMPT